jgi:LacI family transcriptional regulator
MSAKQGEATHKRAPRRRSAGPTVDDVARIAGVSQMTVSRVVNRENNVHPATREKVEKAIAQLGYVPNPAARSLAGGRQCRIALLYSNPSAAYLSEFLVGALRAAAATDAQLVVEHWSGEEKAGAIARRLAVHRIDAVLLPPPLSDDAELIKALRKAGLPIAQVATGRPLAQAHAVTIDDAAAARAITAHLIEFGHRRIGFIAGNPNQTASALRQRGYEAALGEAELEIDPALIQRGDFSYRSGLEAAELLLAQTPRPTAIFASNDDMAAAAVSVAHRHHLEVPEHLAVCGFDDTAMATTIWPELTTIRQPVAEMAEAALALLVQAVRGDHGSDPPAPQHARLPFALIVRGSSAPPQAD